jgi:actin
MLFKPYINGMEYDGIDQTLFSSIVKCDIGYRKNLYSNIVLSGGTTMFPEIVKRIEEEIIKLVHHQQ